MLIVVGLALVSAAAVIGAVAFVLIGVRPEPGVRGGLNAAYATTYTPRPSIPRPSQPILQTQAPGTFLPAPTDQAPQATLDPATLPDDPLMAFAERVHRGDASYRVTSSGVVRIGSAKSDFGSEMSVDGLDRAGWYTFSVAGLSATTDLVVKDGVGYLRPRGEGWTQEAYPSGMPGDFLEGFTGADVAMLTYEGVERQNGRALHHLRLPNVDWRTLRGLLGQANDADVRDIKLDIWVTSSGVPVRARFTIDASYLEAGVEVDLKANLNYRFTEYGEAHPIDAPEQFEHHGSGANS